MQSSTSSSSAPPVPLNASATAPFLQVEHLSMTFGTKKVLKDVNLRIAPKESFVVIGGSGSGKSVLLKSLVGLYRPTTGKITVESVLQNRDDPAVVERWMERCGVLFQGGALFDSLPVWHNISFAGYTARKLSRSEAEAQAVHWLAMVGLPPETARVFPNELSGGMQKRVALARSIAHRPSFIFFDEPTTGLDPITTDMINQLIVHCSKSLGATTFTITHDMASVRTVGDRVALLYDGRFVWEGTIKEMDQTSHPYVCQFIHGSSRGPIES
jgi:phospholipid/cholesterol/gamma-HCH transport system ATP-binding protein